LLVLTVEPCWLVSLRVASILAKDLVPEGVGNLDFGSIEGLLDPFEQITFFTIHAVSDSYQEHAAASHLPIGSGDPALSQEPGRTGFYFSRRTNHGKHTGHDR